MKWMTKRQAKDAPEHYKFRERDAWAAGYNECLRLYFSEKMTDLKEVFSNTPPDDGDY